jgi:hypothetical protein
MHTTALEDSRVSHGVAGPPTLPADDVAASAEAPLLLLLLHLPLVLHKCRTACTASMLP